MMNSLLLLLSRISDKMHFSFGFVYISVGQGLAPAADTYVFRREQAPTLRFAGKIILRAVADIISATAPFCAYLLVRNLPARTSV